MKKIVLNHVLQSQDNSNVANGKTKQNVDSNSGRSDTMTFEHLHSNSFLNALKQEPPAPIQEPSVQYHFGQTEYCTSAPPAPPGQMFVYDNSFQTSSNYIEDHGQFGYMTDTVVPVSSGVAAIHPYSGYLPASPPSSSVSSTTSPTMQRRSSTPRTPSNGYRSRTGSMVSSQVSPGQQQQQQPTTTTSSPSKSGKKISKTKIQPYIPSYMDVTNGPEPCVVCGDAATGYHYRCMTCEGCKGFFRRTIQKNLQYHCKWNENCQIDKNSRNQCQQCRFNKCISVGMATDLVLNEKQRVAKRKLIEENRMRRGEEIKRLKEDSMDSVSLPQHCQPSVLSIVPPPPVHYQTVSVHELCDNSPELSSEHKSIIDKITCAYEHSWIKEDMEVTSGLMAENLDEEDVHQQKRENPGMFDALSSLMSKAVNCVIKFARGIPGFVELTEDDQFLLLKSSCMEILCLRVACRYTKSNGALTLSSGQIVTRESVRSNRLGEFVEPLFDFAAGLSKLNLDTSEIALLAAVLLMQNDRMGLMNSDKIENIQDNILNAFKRYVTDKRPRRSVDWAKILMKVTDLRTIVTRQGDHILTMRFDSKESAELVPALFTDIFCDFDFPTPPQQCSPKTPDCNYNSDSGLSMPSDVEPITVQPVLSSNRVH